MINIAIVEDEISCAKLLGGYINQFQKETGEVCEITYFSSGVDLIGNYKPIFDIIFMDIEMPHLDGMKTAQKLRKLDENVILIFVTNMAQYAIKGYAVQALDFMIKPVEYFDFSIKLETAIRCRKKHRGAEIFVEQEDTIKRIDIGDIYYIEVMNHSLIYHLKNGRLKAIGQLKDLESKLLPLNFFRCNNCYLVNLKYVIEIRQNTIRVGKDELPVSRRKKKDFLQVITSYLGDGGVGIGI